MGSINAHPGLLDRTVSQQVSLCLPINWIKLSRPLSSQLFNVSITSYFRMQSGIHYSGVVPHPMPAADVDVTAAWIFFPEPVMIHQIPPALLPLATPAEVSALNR